MHVDVVPETAARLPQEAYTYAVPSDLCEQVLVGSRVLVPFGKKSIYGYVVARDVPALDSARPVEAVEEALHLFDWQVSLARAVGSHYAAPLGEVIKAMVPAGARRRPSNRKRRSESQLLATAREPLAANPLQLTEAQAQALTPILEAMRQSRSEAFLLHGVTGSGKTELYMRVAQETVQHGKQAIVLVPEISLTPQTVERFASRFAGRIAVVHSALTAAERAKEWFRIRDGEAGVVIGSRSAIFAPVPKLGAVIIDEEDSWSYKQDRLPRYHAVEVARILCRLRQSVLVLGSATPRVETFYQAHTGGYTLLSLPGRIGDRELPKIEVVDLREEDKAGNHSAFSPLLQRALRECHADGGQSILFLNRRGTATALICRSCGAAESCPHCSVSLVYHHIRRVCHCHYCGLSRSTPAICRTCGGGPMTAVGRGTERLEAEMHELFPEIRLLRMDRDTTITREAYFDFYRRFAGHQADCLIGTQMIAKGWDIGNVRLVGIVNADTSLHYPDYRSGELTFSLITQVAGRAGRGKHPARVILQTHSPQHYAIRHALQHDYLNFAREETRLRKRMQFPPYTRLVVCTFSHGDDGRAQHQAQEVADSLRPRLPGGVELLGPMPAFVHKLRGEYRWQMTLRGQEVDEILPLLPQSRGWAVDVDPGP